VTTKKWFIHLKRLEESKFIRIFSQYTPERSKKRKAI